MQRRPNHRFAVARRCVGTIVCEPGKHTTPEEQALLRYMGRHFVKSVDDRCEKSLDAKNHWSIGTNGKDQSETTDYRITSDDRGVMGISFERVTKMPGVQGFSATTDGTLIYDSNLTVPREISEDTLLRTSLVNGSIVQGGYEQVHTLLNLKLLDDSMAAKRP